MLSIKNSLAFAITVFGVGTIAAPAKGQMFPGMFVGSVNDSITTPTATTKDASGVVLLNGLPSPTDYFSTVLYHHNIHRLNHSAGLLTYDTSLADEVGTVTLSCVAHMQDLGNFYGFSSDGAPGSAPEMTANAINAWYNSEMENYVAPSDNYTIEVQDFSNFENWGHFTAVVWASATKVGCWSNSCPSTSAFCNGWTVCWVVMCKYDTENIGPLYSANVLPPKGMPIDGSSPWAPAN